MKAKEEADTQWGGMTSSFGYQREGEGYFVDMGGGVLIEVIFSRKLLYTGGIKVISFFSKTVWFNFRLILD